MGGSPGQPFSIAGLRGGKDVPRHLWPAIKRVIEEVQPVSVFFENVPGHLTLGFDEVVGDLEALDYQVAAGLFTAEEVGSTQKRERLFVMGRSKSLRRAEWRPEPAGREGLILSTCNGDTLASANAQLLDWGGAGEAGGIADDPDGRAELAGAGDARLSDSQLDLLQGAGRGEEGRAVTEFRLPQFPPGPDDLDAWAAILLRHPELAPAIAKGSTAQSPLRGVADGLGINRVDRLRCCGNGVVPDTAALAYLILNDALEPLNCCRCGGPVEPGDVFKICGGEQIAICSKC